MCALRDEDADPLLLRNVPDPDNIEDQPSDEDLDDIDVVDGHIGEEQLGYSSGSADDDSSSEERGSNIGRQGRRAPSPRALPGIWVRAYPGERQRNIKRKFKVRDVGPRETNDCITPLDFFLLFLSDTIWNMMVDATNRFAQQTLLRMNRDGNFGPQSRMRRWVDVSVAEMKKFWAIMLNMGLRTTHDLPQFRSTKSNLFQPFYSRTMPLWRFELILSQFQVSSQPAVPRDQIGYDPWVKFRDFIDTLNDAFKRHFVPSQEICIDESMIGMKNRCVFIQYMPNKRHSRFGIKKFELCDSASGYLMHVALYSGTDFLQGGTDPFTQRVVTELMQRCGLLNKWYHLFTDNFYTKIPLAHYLYNNKTFLTGTLNKACRFLSINVRSSELAVGETLYYRRSKVLVVKYKERKSKKPVHLMSTAYAAANAEIVSRSGARKIKPVMIHHYDQHMGGVDYKDKNIYHLTCTRQTKKYWKKVVYNFVDMALFNAYHLYKLSSSRPISKFNFISEIVVDLIRSNQPAIAVPVLPPIPAGHALTRIGPVGQKLMRLCNVCNKRALFWCPGCNTGVHKQCFARLNHEIRAETRRRHMR